MNTNKYRPVIIWLFTGCFLVFAMVIIGGITRLTGSGLSITEWNVIMGSIPPLNHQDWVIAFEKYRLTPQFRIMNSGMSLEEFKSIFFWEYLHRLIGRIIGIVFIIPFLYFILKNMLNPWLTRQLIIIFLLGGFQGFLGWYMVASGLVDIPAVSHYRLAAHLITAFLTYGYILWVALTLIYGQRANIKTENEAKPFKSLSVTILSITVLQIIYGAFVAGLKMGKGYNTWPKMGSEWFPESIFAHPTWKTFLQDWGVQFVHRYIALILVVMGVILYARFRKYPDASLKGSVIFFLCALAMQFTLGVFTLLYAAPVTLAVFHQMGGFVLLTSVIILVHRAVKPEYSYQIFSQQSTVNSQQ
jgi:heme a synthase